MDKRLILAVAGSGKTAYLLDKLDLQRRFLIVTYTNSNYQNIYIRIIKKFGYFPQNITLLTYFKFLYSFCFKPFLLMKLDTKGINFKPCLNRFARGDQRYLDSNKRVYSNRLAKLIVEKNEHQSVTTRLSKYFDWIMIDEIQDFSAHDFNFLSSITNSKCNILFVGDFYQHTYDTSVDGRTNQNLHSSYPAYLQRFEAMGLVVDTTSLSDSYRCSPAVCRYVTNNLGIQIGSHRTDETAINFITSETDIYDLYQDPSIVKLFYQQHHSHSCFSKNWGGSKGEDRYSDVCVVLNATSLKHYTEGLLHDLPPSSKNKLYVAITRTRNNLYFFSETLLKKVVSKKLKQAA